MSNEMEIDVMSTQEDIDASLRLFNALPHNPSLLERVKLKLELIRIELGDGWYEGALLEADLLKWGLRRRYTRDGVIAVIEALRAATLTERMAAHVFIIEVLES